MSLRRKLLFTDYGRHRPPGLRINLRRSGESAEVKNPPLGPLHVQVSGNKKSDLRMLSLVLLLAQGTENLMLTTARRRRRRLGRLRAVETTQSIEVRRPRRVSPEETTTASPVCGPYVGESEVVLGKVKVELEEMHRTKAYPMAGPRSKILPIRKAAIMTCGGLCPGLNAVVYEVARCLRTYGVRDVVGIEEGYMGLERGQLKAMDEIFSKDIFPYAQAGTVLGTSRGKRSPEAMNKQLEDNGIDAVFVVGGDGTLRGATQLAGVSEKTRIVAVPKTIDNDIPVVDRSFGFDTAVAAAKDAIVAAIVEAKAFPRGLGIVRLMGRDAGFLAVHAALACPDDVDAVLIPEKGFDVDSLLRYLDETLERKGHAVVVAAEGVNTRLHQGDPVDVGSFLRDRVLSYFDGVNRSKISLKYVDPSYMVRALPPNAADTILCSRLASSAVHAAAAGYTDCAVAAIHGHFAIVPLQDLTSRASIVAVAGNLWSDLVRSTGQPDFAPTPEDLACLVDDDGNFRESPSGGCVVPFSNDV